MKDILLSICALILLGSFIWLVGMFGAIDTDQAELADIVPQLIICIVLLMTAAFGLNKLESEEDIYDRL